MSQTKPETKKLSMVYPELGIFVTKENSNEKDIFSYCCRCSIRMRLRNLPNTYSVPDYLVGRALSIYATPTSVKIYDGNKEVASHPRSFERYKQLINPLHRSYSRLSTKAKMQRIYEVIAGLHPDVAEFLAKNQACGEDPQRTAYQIFKLLKEFSRGMILSIISECLTRRSPRLKTLLSYLQIQPEEEREVVCPQNPDLLNITYKARALEEYEDESE